MNNRSALRLSIAASVVTAFLHDSAGARVAAAAATGKDVAVEMRALRQHDRTLIAARERLASALSLTAKPDPGNGGVVFQIKEAWNRQPLTMQLLLRNGACTRGVANMSRHAPRGGVDVSGLTLRDGRLRGVLRVTLTPYPRAQSYPIHGDNYVDCDPRTWTYDLDVKVRGTHVTGTARRTNARGAATDAAELSCEGTFHPLAHPEFPKPSLETMESGPSAEADWLGRTVTDTYEQIRALELTRTLGLPFDLALQQIPRYRPRRPELERTGRAKSSGKAPPSLGDLDIGDDLGLDDGASEEAVDYGPVLARARAIRERTQRMVDAVKRHDAEGAEVSPVRVGGMELADPEFGPWFDIGPLPSAKAKNNIIPAGAGEPGDQRWQYVDYWTGTGPFVDRRAWPMHMVLLPDLIPAPGASCIVDKSIEQNEGYGAGNPAPPGSCRASPDNGLARPPLWSHGDKFAMGEARYSLAPGLDWTACYAWTEVHSDRDCELWAAAVINDVGALWINDRLVWDSGDHQYISKTRHQLFRARLRRGANTLIVRCKDRQHPTWFGVFFCTRGAPRDAADVEADTAVRETAYAELRPPTFGTAGWRGDRQGNYPGAKPVTAWDYSKRINVIWRRPMFKVCASLVVVGDSLFTVNEPYFLVCVDRSTGATRWERACSPLELKDKTAYAEMESLHDRLLKERNAALLLRGEIEEAKRTGRKDGLTAKQAAVKSATAALEETQKEISELSRKHGCPSYGFGDGDVANLFPTPVTDGMHVWVKLRGMVACFDFDGNRKWMVDAEAKYTPSLLLVDAPDESGGGRPSGVLIDTDTAAERCRFTAWNAASGEERWRQEGGVPGKWLTGSPVAMRLTNGKESMVVVIGATCDILRLNDGKRLLRDVEFQRLAGKEHDTMLVDRDVLYVSRNLARDRAVLRTAEIAAFRMVMIDRDTIGAVPLWSTIVKVDSYCGLIKHGGLLMQLTGGGEYGMGKLWIMDTTTGRLQRPVMKLTGTPMADTWVPPCMVGDTLIINDSWRGGPSGRVSNNMTAVRMTPRPHVIARNPMERTIGAPTFADDRSYLRTFNSLMCLGYSGDEGRRYEAEVNAYTVLGSIPVTRPDASEPVEPEPSRERFWGDMHTLWPGRLIGGWTLAGPFPKRLRDAARAALGHPRWKQQRLDEKGEGTITVGSADFPVGRWGLTGSFEDTWETVAWRYKPQINVTSILTNHADGVSYWYSEISTGRDSILRFELDVPSVSAWIAGVPIRHNRRVHLKPGHYPMVLEVAADEIPEGGVRIGPRFWDSGDPKAEIEARLNHLRLCRRTLERAARLSPGSDIGKLSAKLLDEVR